VYFSSYLLADCYTVIGVFLSFSYKQISFCCQPISNPKDITGLRPNCVAFVGILKSADKKRNRLPIHLPNVRRFISADNLVREPLKFNRIYTISECKTIAFLHE